AAPSPPRASIQLGIYELAKDSYYQVLTNAAPRLITGPFARALPAALGEAPLVLQPRDPTRPLEIPVRVPLDGTITAQGVDGRPTSPPRTKPPTRMAAP